MRDHYTGKVDKVNAALICLMLDNGYTLVIAPHRHQRELPSLREEDFE